MIWLEIVQLKTHLFRISKSNAHTRTSCLKTYSFTHSLSNSHIGTSTKRKKRNDNKAYIRSQKLTGTHARTHLRTYIHSAQNDSHYYTTKWSQICVCLLVLNGIWIECPLWFLLQYWIYWSYYWYALERFFFDDGEGEGGRGRGVYCTLG